jgi:hypothetical protein
MITRVWLTITWWRTHTVVSTTAFTGGIVAFVADAMIAALLPQALAGAADN